MFTKNHARGQSPLAGGGHRSRTDLGEASPLVNNHTNKVNNNHSVNNGGVTTGLPSGGGAMGRSAVGNPNFAKSGSLGEQGQGLGSTLTGSVASCSPQIVVGKGAHIEGNITKTNSMVISGTANIEAHDVEVFNVTETGVVSGNVSVTDAVIEGKFKGQMTVKGKLSIRSAAVVEADVVYAEIEIEKGGCISGQLSRPKVQEEKKDIPLNSATTSVVGGGSSGGVDNGAGITSAEEAETTH